MSFEHTHAQANGQHPALGKTALVLAGGGVVGAVYEIGALLALNEMLLGKTANDFDIYVGTSAGALVGSLLANGVTPVEMAQIMDDAHPKMRGLRARDILRWNAAGLGRWGLRLPAALLRGLTGGLGPVDLSHMLFSLSEALPPGLFNNAGLERFLAQAYRRLGGSNRFEALQRQLYIIATNFTTGQRAVFRRGHRTGATISAAVAASTAVPLLYKPVRIGPHSYVDGGLRGNASLDVAIERGAKLVFCINPMVPLAPNDGDDDEAAATHSAFEADAAWRTLRIVTHAGLHYHIKHLRQQNPEVDIICLEPRADQAELLTANIMRYSARRRLLRLSYERASADLAERHATLAPILARHGLACRAAAGDGGCPAPPASRPLGELQQTLEQLERRLAMDELRPQTPA